MLVLFFFFVQQRHKIRPNSGTFKKNHLLHRCYSSVLLSPSGKWKWPQKKNQQRFMHSIPSESFRKGCYCLAEASALSGPSLLQGRQAVSTSSLSPRRASEVRTGLSTATAPRPPVIVPPAMQNSRPSGTRWARSAAAVALLSWGWLVSDRGQTHMNPDYHSGGGRKRRVLHLWWKILAVFLLLMID